jgi:uncharacterized protein (DUF952 family)
LDRIVYKIMSSSEVKQMRDDGEFRGSSADVADRYIHLSCGSQLASTLDKYFTGVEGEPARGGQLFPHI